MRRRPLIWRVTPDELARSPYVPLREPLATRVQRGGVRLFQVGCWAALIYGLYLVTSHALHGIAMGTIR